MTVEQFICEAASTLSSSPTPRLDAEVLVMFVTGLTRTQLITRAGENLTAAQETSLRAMIARRRAGEPIAFLTGHREFWSLDMRVTPDVLIPRPETEILVEQALLRIPHDVAWQIADLGTGSGAVALAVAKERPRCHLVGIDASERALAVARANAERLGIGNIEFRLGNWFEPVAKMKFDMVVGNPPYVAEGDPHLTQGDVRFEPRAALVSGADGLDAIRTIASAAPRYLVSGGWHLLEHAHDQGGVVTTLLRDIGFIDIRVVADFAGHERCSAGRLRKA